MTRYNTYLVTSEDPEGLHHLLSCVSVGRLACHEVEERVKGHRPRVVWVNDRHDALEVSLTLHKDENEVAHFQVSQGIRTTKKN